jgi:hypothetical protein
VTRKFVQLRSAVTALVDDSRKMTEAVATMYAVSCQHPDSPPLSIEQTEWETIMFAFRTFRLATCCYGLVARRGRGEANNAALDHSRPALVKARQASHRPDLLPFEPKKATTPSSPAACKGRQPRQIRLTDLKLPQQRATSIQNYILLCPLHPQVGHCGSPMPPPSPPTLRPSTVGLRDLA